MKKRVVSRFKTHKRQRTFFREWRKYRTMTLEQAAEASGMTIGNIGHIEQGNQGYTQDALEALAKAYRTSPGWLLDVNPLDDTLFPPDGSTPDELAKLRDFAKLLKNP